MSWQAHRLVTYYSKINVFTLARLLHLLADCANADCVIDPAPNQETMAAFLGCTSRSIRSHIAALIAAGELEQFRVGHGPGTSSAYRIIIVPPVIPEKSGTIPPVIPEKSGTIPPVIPEKFSAIPEKSGANTGNYSVEYDADDPGSVFRSEEEERAPSRGLGRDFFKANNIPLPAGKQEWDLVNRPSITAWLTATNQWPGWDTLAYLDVRLGNVPNRESLAMAWGLWRASGYRTTNIVGVLDWYENLCQNPNWRPGLAAQPNPGQKMATSDYLTTNPLVANEWSL